MRVSTSGVTSKRKIGGSNDIFEKCRNFTRPSDLQSAGLYMYFEVFGDREGCGPGEVRMGNRRVLMFGSNDYLALITHPKVKEAERYVIETSLKMGKHPRAEIAHPDQAKEYLDIGVRHFCIGTDVAILYDWFKRNGKEMGSLIGRSPSDEPIRDFRGEGGGAYRGGA